jgi:hypothetical protein
MIKQPERESFSSKPFWHTRAWTFQERTVSPSTLVFTNDTVYWQCRSNTWYENIKAEPDGIPSPENPSPENSLEISVGFPSYTLKTNPWPDIRQYFGLVSGYNHRNLSFESDALCAFTAIVTAMSKSFPGGFHFGLPVFLFDVSILWSAMTPLRRRNGFPSWSWLGWTGRINLDLGYQLAWNPSFDRYRRCVRLQPLINWHAIYQHRRSSHLIDNSCHLHQGDLRDPDFSPSGG